VKNAFVLLLMCGVCCSSALAQVDVSGQGSVAYVKSDNGASQYVYNNGNATFSWRWDVFADMNVAENMTLSSNLRMLQDQVLHIDYFALRVTDIASSGINAQMGLIDLPFGNLGERRFPKQNPFFNLPLMNEHLTSLCASDYRLWVLVPQFAIHGDGVRLLDQGLYDLGIKIFGTLGMFDYAAALTNGMISETGTYAPNGLNAKKDFGKIFRLAATPMMGLTIGASYATGPFMDDQSADPHSAIFGSDPREYPQHIVMGDIDFSYEHFSLYGQAAYNVWKFEEENTPHSRPDLKAFAYSAEARYAVTPRLSVASRVGGIVFNTVTDSVPSLSGRVLYTGTWDRDVIRLEGALGYHMTRELLLKVMYQWNKTIGLKDDPVDNLFVVQTVVDFH
jgi:hypothetical protein